jgi:hypothetical protein
MTRDDQYLSEVAKKTVETAVALERKSERRILLKIGDDLPGHIALLNELRTFFLS